MRKSREASTLTDGSEKPLGSWRGEFGETCALGEMVEAAGVEPASENSGSPAPTCVSLLLVLVHGLSGERGPDADQPLNFRGPRRGGRGPLAHIMTLRPAA